MTGTGNFAAKLLVSVIVLLSVGRVGVSAGEMDEQPVRYMIVITGGELLEGAFPDAHTVFLTRTLHPLGLRCVGSICIDDDMTDIQDAMQYATERAQLVIVTGGLGPTDDDITREALRDFTGIPLEEHPDVLAGMARRFNVPVGELRANLRRQTQVPTRGGYLRNPTGTAVGIIFETDRHVIVVLPGPPRELQPMVRDELVPYLSRRFGTRSLGASLTLRFVGLGESQVAHTLRNHAPLPENVTSWSQFEGNRVDFTFSLPTNAPEDRARLADYKERIARHLGDHIYSDDMATSLEAHVVKLLEARGATLAVAEIGSGGALAAALNGPGEAQQLLARAYVAPTAERMRQMLGSSQPAADDASPNTSIGQLAHDLASAAASGYAVVVGESRQNGSSTFVDVAIRLPDGRVESRPIRLIGPDNFARARLVTDLLDQLRRRLR